MPRTRLMAVVALVWLLTAGGFGPANAATDPTLVATVPSMDLDPRTNGKVIVYNTWPGSMDVYAVDIDGGKPVPIATGKGDQVLVGISGDWVLWYESSDVAPHGAVRATNLVTHRVVTISGEHGAASPALSGDWVIWIDSAGKGQDLRSQLFARNLETLAPAQLLATSPVRVDVWPMISGKRVVWAEMDRQSTVLNGPRTDHWRLRELSVDDPTPLTIAEGSETSHCTQESGDVIGCALQSGSMIGAITLNDSIRSYVETMFDGRRRSVVRDLDTGRITIVGGEAVELISDGRFAFWSGATEQPSRIHAFDLTTGKSLTLVEDAGLNLSSTTAFSIGDGWLVWGRAPAGVFKSKPPSEELHAARIEDLLASAVSPNDVRWHPGQSRGW